LRFRRDQLYGLEIDKDAGCPWAGFVGKKQESCGTQANLVAISQDRGFTNPDVVDKYAISAALIDNCRFPGLDFQQAVML